MKSNWPSFLFVEDNSYLYFLFLCWYHMSISVVVVSLNDRVWCFVCKSGSSISRMVVIIFGTHFNYHRAGNTIYTLTTRNYICTNTWPLMIGSREQSNWTFRNCNGLLLWKTWNGFVLYNCMITVLYDAGISILYVLNLIFLILLWVSIKWYK